MKVGILNVTGYAGVELARILHRHAEVEITAVTGRGSAGKKLGDVFPHLADLDLTITEDLTDSVDFVISALPHGVSAERLGPLLRGGVSVVDISADFRLKNVAEFEEWYAVEHPCPEFLKNAVYGLTELYRAEVAQAKLVANPGCYPTAAVLALAPALEAGIVESDIVIDAKSGVSGSGRALSLATHFSEVNESVAAYSFGGHRHLPEITQELQARNGQTKPRVTFLPHLVPMTRGVMASCYAPLRPGALEGKTPLQELQDLYRNYYKEGPFVKVANQPPATKQTLGSNTCLVYPTLDLRAGRLIAIGCLDNLVKGAAGQAVQNMNVMSGLPESQGLEQLALYP